MTKIQLDVDAVKFYGKLKTFRSQTELCSPYNVDFSSEAFWMFLKTIRKHLKHSELLIKTLEIVERSNLNADNNIRIIFKTL
jgi:hypothetical protein